MGGVEVGTAIRDFLDEWKSREGFTLLFAVESGSRAWGFPSPDSDFDIRFLYVRPAEWYLSVQSRRDVLEAMAPADLDFVGWDLQKALPLLRKSNPSLLEWLESPIVYMANAKFLADLRSLASQCVSLDACLRHYLNMARSNWQVYFGEEEVRLKKYLYVLRPILAARWIERNGSFPPVSFPTLIEQVGESGEVADEIASLLALKAVTSEVGARARRPALDKFAESEMLRLRDICVPSLPPVDMDQLDTFFRHTLTQYSSEPSP
jgi:predicted nucleotidyltransferase